MKRSEMEVLNEIVEKLESIIKEQERITFYIDELKRENELLLDEVRLQNVVLGSKIFKNLMLH